MNENQPTEGPKRSPVESHKEESRQLRGTIGEQLESSADHFGDADKSLIKFHGFYQQEDRDARKSRRKAGGGKAYQFMVRCKIPGGKLTAEQYLAIDDLAGEFANGTMRFTSRQGIQLHGVLMGNLRKTIRGINDCLLTTLGACGDVERNVMCCPAAFDPVRRELQRQTEAIAQHLAPRTGAYHEIWLDGEKLPLAAAPEIEPIYGKVYLPRKFKTALGLAGDNCVDLFANDLAFLALTTNDAIEGFNVLVGGGMGMTHGNEDTFPFIAQPMCWINPDQVVEAAEATVKLFRDHGNRGDRKRARIKYLVHDWGVDKFRDVLKTYLPFPLVAPRTIDVTGFDLHLGWRSQGDGRACLGISIENGRVKDDGSFRYRSGLREVVRRFRPDLSITPQQDLLLRNLDPNDRSEIDRILTEHGIAHEEKISLVQQYSLACPAIPTCGLAISEAERALPAIIDELEKIVLELGLQSEKIGVRMTGCPNGCVRPYQSDIGIVGRSGDKYALFVGGSVVGTRLNYMLKDLVHRDALVPMIRRLLSDFRVKRLDGEGFGDFCLRLGQAEIQRSVE